VTLTPLFLGDITENRFNVFSAPTIRGFSANSTCFSVAHIVPLNKCSPGINISPAKVSMFLGFQTPPPAPPADDVEPPTPPPVVTSPVEVDPPVPGAPPCAAPPDASPPAPPTLVVEPPADDVDPPVDPVSSPQATKKAEITRKMIVFFIDSSNDCDDVRTVCNHTLHQNFGLYTHVDLYICVKITETKIRQLVREEFLKASDEGGMSPSLSEGVEWHLNEGVTFDFPIYRVGTSKYFALFKEARRLYVEGEYVPQTEFEQDLLESDLGEFATYEGKKVPLDFPMMEQDLNEAEYKGRDVELGKPKRGSGGKAYVYVRDPKSGNVRKVSFGSSMPDAMGDSEAARKRRKSFGERHKCSQKKDRTKAGYWACRSTKFFGRDIPGWW